jgi:hypothetical protein
MASSNWLSIMIFPLISFDQYSVWSPHVFHVHVCPVIPFTFSPSQILGEKFTKIPLM